MRCDAANPIQPAVRDGHLGVECMERGRLTSLAAAATRDAALKARFLITLDERIFIMDLETTAELSEH